MKKFNYYNIFDILLSYEAILVVICQERKQNILSSEKKYKESEIFLFSLLLLLLTVNFKRVENFNVPWTMFTEYRQ